MAASKISPDELKRKANQNFCHKCRSFIDAKPVPFGVTAQCWNCEEWAMLWTIEALLLGYLNVEQPDVP